MSTDGPDQLHVMRTAGWMWIAYLVSLLAIDLVIYANQDLSPIFFYHLINLIPAIFFITLSYIKQLHKFDRQLIPAMIVLVSVVPLLMNQAFNLRLPPAPLSNVEGMVLRQLPVLLLSLILVAWHYDIPVMIFYSIAINIFDLLLTVSVSRLDNERATVLYFIIIVRTVCFIVAGIFISQLIQTLRRQQASLKLANKQLAHYSTTVESLTTSRERNRIARELHDTLAHTLTGLSVSLETAKAYFDVDQSKSKELIDRSLSATRSGIEETRRALKSLRASPLEDLGLALAIKQLAESATARSHLNLHLSLPETLPVLSPEIEQCVFRTAQEGVENVCSHANARNLSIDLKYNKKELNLEIRDDGIGFNPENTNEPGHFGLIGMKERAQTIGGYLHLASDPGKGTVISLKVKDEPS
jgi:signal transduction histidine kinase